mmetsp:Transcript_38768/g.82735  ORF Transcript_38768/g.82735 Transcript_38768/m.82735 type:complete len:271 (-) Transcript_38768:689-1501(-)
MSQNIEFHFLSGQIHLNIDCPGGRALRPSGGHRGFRLLRAILTPCAGRDGCLLGLRLTIRLLRRVILFVPLSFYRLLLGGSAPLAAGLFACTASSGAVSSLLLYLLLCRGGVARLLFLRSPRLIICRGRVSVVFGVNSVFFASTILVFIAFLLIGAAAIRIDGVSTVIFLVLPIVTLFLLIFVIGKPQLARQVEAPGAQRADQIAQLQVILCRVLQQFIIGIVVLLVGIVRVGIIVIVVLAVVGIVIIFLSIEVCRLPLVLLSHLLILLT